MSVGGAGRVAPGLTRRQLAGAGIAAAGISLGAAVGARAATSDAELLLRAADVERLVVWCYERVLARGPLQAPVRALVARYAAQERAHLAAVQRAGGVAPAAPLGLTRAEAELAHHHVAASPTALRNQHDCLRLLVDVESVAEAVWFSTISQLSDAAFVTTAAQIMACEAQHWTVLSGISHHDDVKITVPYAFVRGSQ